MLNTRTAPGSSPTYRAGPFAFPLSVQKELRFFACWCMFGDSKIKGRTEGGDDACMRKIIQGPGQAASSFSSSSGRQSPPLTSRCLASIFTYSETNIQITLSPRDLVSWCGLAKSVGRQLRENKVKMLVLNQMQLKAGSGGADLDFHSSMSAVAWFL